MCCKPQSHAEDWNSTGLWRLLLQRAQAVGMPQQLCPLIRGLERCQLQPVLWLELSSSCCCAWLRKLLLQHASLADGC